MMKFKGLCSRISLALLLISPSLYSMQQTTLVAIELPNGKKGDIARVLALYAKEIEEKLNPELNKLGLKFIPLKASQLHVTLFEASISLNDMNKLAQAIENSVKTMNSNSFQSISFMVIERMSNSLVLTIQGDGSNAAQKIANKINEAMGDSALPYHGHITIGKIKLTTQKSGEATTQDDKNRLETILQANSQIIANVTMIPAPSSSFSLDTIYITRGGGSDAKEIASMLVRDIKSNVGTDKSLVKTVDKELK